MLPVKHYYDIYEVCGLHPPHPSHSHHLLHKSSHRQGIVTVGSLQREEIILTQNVIRVEKRSKRTSMQRGGVGAVKMHLDNVYPCEVCELHTTLV